MKKQLVMGSLAVTIMAGVSVPAFADGLGASAGAATMYLWRGTDLGDNQAEVFGDLNYSIAGFYGDAWITSGNQSEYDLSLGYKLALAEDVALDAGVVNYNYSNNSKVGMGTLTDASEVYLKVSAMGATLSYYNAVSTTENNDANAGNDYALLGQGASYTSLSYSMSQFTGLIGHVNGTQTAPDYTHLDVTYAYNDRLSFTASQVVDQTDDAGIDDSTKLVVSYSFPLK